MKGKTAMRIVRCQISLIAAVLMFAPLAAAQGDNTPEGAEITRDAADLRDALHPPPDIDFTDTALVFTNRSDKPGYVNCAGFNANGEGVGRIWLRVPANGLRFAFASDLSDAADFIGSARCRTWPEGIVGSAFLLRPGAVTDVPARQLPLLSHLKARFVPQAVLEEVADADPAAANPYMRQYMVRRRIWVRHGIGFPVVATY
jgi:hypothetical protein